MRRILSILSALLLCLSLAHAVRAEGATLSGSITVELLSGGEWLRLPLHLRYAHERGILADGVLAFVPLAEYAANEGDRIPRVSMTGDLACRISTTDDPDSFSCTRVLYRQEGDQLTVLDDGLSLHDLEPGLYLLSWNVNARRGSESWAGTALAWLCVE